MKEKRGDCKLRIRGAVTAVYSHSLTSFLPSLPFFIHTAYYCLLGAEANEKVEKRKRGRIFFTHPKTRWRRNSLPCSLLLQNISFKQKGVSTPLIR